MPSQRTLPNTVILFRRTLHLSSDVDQATGYITADSRYRLWVNGERVQWGPTPGDPRETEADPVDLKPYLQPGDNVIGIEALFYGHGDGTWAGGKPGVIARFDITDSAGQVQSIATDSSWRCCIDAAYPPGQHKRWFLRSLQEVFDARKHPWGWSEPSYAAYEALWIESLVLECPSDKPAGCSNYEGNDLIESIEESAAQLVERSIPMMRESMMSFDGPTDVGRVTWHRDAQDWFAMRVPGAMTVETDESVFDKASQTLESAEVGSGRYVTYCLSEQAVGFPIVEIEAEAGTVVDIMMQESHDEEHGPKWIDSSHYVWIRLTCHEGITKFESIDFESVRWLQIHVRGQEEAKPVKIHHVGLRRRVFDWSSEAQMKTSEPAMQRLFDAGINTLANSAQETIVDGMGRERQPYSGDGSQQLHAVRYAHGADDLCRRFIRTFGYGLTKEGYFFDCWPAFDRMARLMQRQIDATSWGPLLDHGVGFVTDCWLHYQHTGDASVLEAMYPTLKRFADYLESIIRDDGLLPVEQIGLPSVWIDHFCFPEQRHKRCAFNLYTTGMLKTALAPMAEVLGQNADAQALLDLSKAIETTTVETYWNADRKLFVNNLPWHESEGVQHSCDRSLSMAVLYGQVPGGDTSAILETLVDRPDYLGRSYPANACWRYWALGKLGRGDVVVKEFREEWSQMPSVIQNKTIAENWGDLALPDGGHQWSHCAVSPVFVTYMVLAGIMPTSPGFATANIRPQLGDLQDISLMAHTPRGVIAFDAKAQTDANGQQGHLVTLNMPEQIGVKLILPGQEQGSTIPAGVSEHFVPSV